MAKGQKGLTCWVKPLPKGLPQRIMDCPVLPCILPSRAFPWYAEIHEHRERQRAEGLPCEGWFLGSHEIKGACVSFGVRWDCGISHSLPHPHPGSYLSKCSQQWEVDGLPMAQDAENPIQVHLVLTETAWSSRKGLGEGSCLPSPSTCLNVC